MTKPMSQEAVAPRGIKMFACFMFPCVMFPCILLAAALTLLPFATSAFAAEQAGKAKSQASGQASGQTSGKASGQKARDAKKAGPRAQPWAFGGGKSARTWANKGVDGSTLQKNATALQKNATAPTSGPEKDQNAAAKSSGKKVLSSLLDGDGFTVSVDEERRGWGVSPSRTMRPDEDKATDSQHRVRAFATHQDDNLSIGLGPEFILKDSNDTSTVFKQNHDQPELDAGLGMQFKLDF